MRLLEKNQLSLVQVKHKAQSFIQVPPKMLLLVALTILIFKGTGSKAGDNNVIFDPCTTTGKLMEKDGFSLGVGMTGGISSWYNNSDTNLNILSPCSSHLAAQLPQSAMVAVFRPLIEQIGQLELDNASYVEIRNEFQDNASLIVYAGRNPTIVSYPRYFLYSDGRVPELTLDLYFEGGSLTQLLWKEDSCSKCFSKDQYCRDGSCVTKEEDCQGANLSNSTITNYNCTLAIIITFSGTDMYSQLLTTWYQLNNINRYSMASLFNAIEIAAEENLQRLARS